MGSGATDTSTTGNGSTVFFFENFMGDKPMFPEIVFSNENWLKSGGAKPFSGGQNAPPPLKPPIIGIFQGVGGQGTNLRWRALTQAEHTSSVCI